ncbi:MAG TPA: hypothetical protein VNM91_01200 [Dehalococcoidia bacterium]|nr:hypothetical protein [Dehalococcoidia bacterium]
MAAILSLLSILTSIHHAFGRREARRTGTSGAEKQAAERTRIRELMGDLLAPPTDVTLLPPNLRARADTPDRDTLRESPPPSRRPAWTAIREDRESGD